MLGNRMSRDIQVLLTSDLGLKALERPRLPLWGGHLLPGYDERASMKRCKFV